MGLNLRVSSGLGCVTTIVGVCFASQANAASVALQNATATFSQSSDYTVGAAINGDTGGDFGWAIDPHEGTAQTAAFQTIADVGFVGGSILTFTLSQNYLNHTLGDFRISVTTDDRTSYADGLASGGNVTANWTVLTPSSASAINGTTLTVQGDNSILASGTPASTDTYTVTATTGLTGITGIRLETLPDASLPFNGPGRQTLNGNFVLSEFGVDIQPEATPEPSTYALLMVGGGLVWFMRRRNSVAA